MREVLDALPGLLRADRSPRSTLHDLTGLLRRVFEAEQAAATLLDDDGTFGPTVITEMTPEAAPGPATDRFTVADGLFSDVIATEGCVRIDDLASRPAGEGLPPGHPPMRSFLGVRLMSGRRLIGLMYVGDRVTGAGWTPEDECLMASLGATAGAALGNAVLLRDALQARRWMRAANHLTGDVLSSEVRGPLRIIADRARDLADADIAAMLLLEDDMVHIRYARGLESERLLSGTTFALEPDTWVSRVISTGRAQMVTNMLTAPSVVLRHISGVHLGPAMLLPLHGSSTVVGALFLARRNGASRFTETDLEIATGFANHAAVMLELAAARRVQERIRVLEDRSRIARDLHDHVVQRLYGAGLTLQRAVTRIEGAPRERVRDAIASLDETIREIRNTILTLRSGEETTASLEEEVVKVAREATPLLGFAPVVDLEPPSGELTGPLVADLAVSVREGLSNVVRHAEATAVELRGAVRGGHLELTLRDNGTGIRSDRRSGLSNLEKRMEEHRGTFQATTHPDGGTLLRWRAPVPRRH